ncbi:hypothetical protein KPP03845_104420 [Streptomyces xanthophaeus]|uniref:hypothetical protein n=1 Tax=Streptomyces xanthophaeus TaxID=67385 RepID=UPI00233EF3D1|nr:hypothetical protein [Streptomyces xanthophaeus]WCD88019.1 hypothetical protein KPP03845_104420 [Streptomyces xanthophaeus]
MTADGHPEPSEEDRPLAELRRIESDPAYRALFLARLDTAIVRREAERVAFAAAAAAAATAAAVVVAREWIA